MMVIKSNTLLKGMLNEANGNSLNKNAMLKWFLFECHCVDSFY